METKELKWWQMRRLKLTRQHRIGIFAGLGMGLVLASSFPPYWAILVRTVGIVVTSMASIVAHQDQQQIEKINQTA